MSRTRVGGLTRAEREMAPTLFKPRIFSRSTPASRARASPHSSPRASSQANVRATLDTLRDASAEQQAENYSHEGIIEEDERLGHRYALIVSLGQNDSQSGTALSASGRGRSELLRFCLLTNWALRALPRYRWPRALEGLVVGLRRTVYERGR